MTEREDAVQQAVALLGLIRQTRESLASLLDQRARLFDHLVELGVPERQIGPVLAEQLRQAGWPEDAIDGAGLSYAGVQKARRRQ